MIMNKKIVSLISLVFLLNSCSSWNEGKEVVNTTEKLGCYEPISIQTWSGQNLTLKGKVITNNVNNIISNNGWNINYLNCEKWQKVNKSTLIAKITPDSSDPNIQNLYNQSSMIKSQIANTNGIISSTKSNFSTQLNLLNIQKSNLESQLKILQNSLGKISEQKDFWVSDIDKQLETLQIQLETLDTQINDLNNSKNKLEDSKKADIEKLDLNYVNTTSQAKSLIGVVLLQIDELYGISETNKNKNDEYDTYLWAKNTQRKDSIKNQWYSNNETYKNFSNGWVNNATYIQSLIDYVSLTKDSIKDSVSSTTFSQSTIDSLYSIFTQYETNLINIKNGLDDIRKWSETVKNTYDTQILALSTQINGSENSKRSIESNINNIKSNKLGTFTTSVDLQTNQLESQIETAKTSLSNINEQINALKSQEQIQLNQLNSQLSQLQSSINTININLNSQDIYAETNGTIKEKVATLWNKVWPNSLLCQILPDTSSLKLQIYSSIDLSLPLDVSFDIDGKIYMTKLTTKLPYQDTVTQNYIYETESNIFLDGKAIDLSTILSEGKVLDVSSIWKNNNTKNNNTIYVPLDYISSNINSNQIKLKTLSWWIVEKKVTLWELNSNQVEVRDGLSFWDTICK